MLDDDEVVFDEYEVQLLAAVVDENDEAEYLIVFIELLKALLDDEDELEKVRLELDEVIDDELDDIIVLNDVMPLLSEADDDDIEESEKIE